MDENEKKAIASTAEKVQSEEWWKEVKENGRLLGNTAYFVGCTLASNAWQNGKCNGQDFAKIQLTALIGYLFWRYCMATDGIDKTIRKLNRTIGTKVLKDMHPEDPQQYAKLGVNVDDAVAAALEREEPDSSPEITLSKRIISIAVEIGHQAGTVIPMIFK